MMTLKVLLKIERAFIVLLLSVAAVFEVFQIVARATTGVGWAWGNGVVVMLTIWACFLAGAVGIELGDHIALDIVAKRLPGRSRNVIQILVDILLLVFVGTLFAFSLNYLVFLTQFGGTSLNTYLPAWVEFLGVPVSACLMTIHSLHQLVLHVRKVLLVC